MKISVREKYTYFCMTLNIMKICRMFSLYIYTYIYRNHSYGWLTKYVVIVALCVDPKRNVQNYLTIQQAPDCAKTTRRDFHFLRTLKYISIHHQLVNQKKIMSSIKIVFSGSTNLGHTNSFTIYYKSSDIIIQ